MECRFNQPLPARLFVPAFPRSARVVDLDAGQRRPERRLAAGIARQRVGDRTFVIRDLQVNAEGDVFLLYTAGKWLGDRWQDFAIGVGDDAGTAYLDGGGSVQPDRDGRGPLANRFVFDGERLEGKWWVPVEPQRPWRARDEGDRRGEDPTWRRIEAALRGEAPE